MNAYSLKKITLLTLLISFQNAHAECIIWDTISNAPCAIADGVTTLIEGVPGGTLALKYPLAAALLATATIYTTQHVIAQEYYNDAESSWLNRTLNFLIERYNPERKNNVAALEEELIQLRAIKAGLEAKIAQLTDELAQAGAAHEALLQALNEASAHIQELEAHIEGLNAENIRAYKIITQLNAAFNALGSSGKKSVDEEEVA